MADTVNEQGPVGVLTAAADRLDERAARPWDGPEERAYDRAVAGWLRAEAAARLIMEPFVELVSAVMETTSGSEARVSLARSPDGEIAFQADTFAAALAVALTIPGGTE